MPVLQITRGFLQVSLQSGSSTRGSSVMQRPAVLKPPQGRLVTQLHFSGRGRAPQRSLAPQQPRQRWQQRPQPPRLIAAQASATAASGNGSGAGVKSRVHAKAADRASAEAAYASFDWKAQWYPVAFVRDMPEGEAPL